MLRARCHVQELRYRTRRDSNLRSIERTAMPYVAKARVDALRVEEVHDEVLVYDLARRKAHSLNRQAALLWRLCDGTRDIAELAAALAVATGLEADADVVLHGLRQLDRQGLLAE